MSTLLKDIRTKESSKSVKKLYHLSAKYLGDRVKLKALVPENMDKTEVDFPRVCAAPSIKQCIIAIHDMEWFIEKKADGILCLFVYEMENADDFEPYEDVYDYDLTAEHISKKDSWATFKGIVHIPNSHRAGYLNPEKTQMIEIPFFRCAYEHIDNGVFEEHYSEYYDFCKIS